jgi:ribosomal protein S18 acetylase RimI-like enzyme
MSTSVGDFHAELRIRDAEPDDAPQLSAFAATLFRAAYTATSRPADLESYIADHFRPEIQAAEIAAADCRTLLLHLDGQLAGYAHMRRGPGPSCLVPGVGAPVEALEIQRFYVAPLWRGRGVARVLMTACLHAAAAGTSVWLGVFTHNARAIAFYTKCGFRVVGSATFYMGEDPQHDHVMQWTGETSSAWSERASGHPAAGDTGR